MMKKQAVSETGPKQYHPCSYLSTTSKQNLAGHPCLSPYLLHRRHKLLLFLHIPRPPRFLQPPHRLLPPFQTLQRHPRPRNPINNRIPQAQYRAFEAVDDRLDVLEAAFLQDALTSDVVLVCFGLHVVVAQAV
jgi:hypothetical protein